MDKINWSNRETGRIYDDFKRYFSNARRRFATKPSLSELTNWLYWMVADEVFEGSEELSMYGKLYLNEYLDAVHYEEIAEVVLQDWDVYTA